MQLVFCISDTNGKERRFRNLNFEDKSVHCDGCCNLWWIY